MQSCLQHATGTISEAIGRMRQFSSNYHERELQMKTKREEYIVIAESAVAKVFKTGARHEELSLVQTIENPEGRKQPRELDADRQGMNRTTVAGYHGMSGDED